jgi:3-oxoacyl-[acyl-carrier-protein] synthase II
LDALGLAYRAIRRGAADVLIAGGCEALLHPTMLWILAYGTQCTPGQDRHAYRPFDRQANGLILAEGAGICVLEAYDHALQRGAPLYGEIVGYGQTHDAPHGQTPPPSGAHYARAITLAMHEGALAPTDIGYGSLDGRAMPAWDRTEADAWHRALGAEAVYLPVSVPRTMLGHSYAAAGALDTITAVLGLHHHLVPPTINCQEVDAGYGLNVVRETPEPLTRPAVLIGGRGLSGANVVLAIKQLAAP